MNTSRESLRGRDTRSWDEPAESGRSSSRNFPQWGPRLPSTRAALVFLTVLFVWGPSIESDTLAASGEVNSYARLPHDTPLDAVKWTGGFWKDRLQCLRDIYLPGVLDGSFMTVENGATFHNFLKAAGMEQGVNGASMVGWRLLPGAGRRIAVVRVPAR